MTIPIARISSSNRNNHVIALPLGCTMIELMVSIAILSLVLTLLYGAFFQISSYSIQIKNSLQGRQELRLLMKMVLDDLRSVQYLDRMVFLNNKDTNADNVLQSGIIARNIKGPNESGLTEIHFHAAVPTRFFPEAKNRDPELHEIGYDLEYDQGADKWQFKRREDFYIDNNMTEGGKEYVLSEAVVGFELEFLETLTQRADGSTQERWTKEWDSKDPNNGPKFFPCRIPSERQSSKEPCVPDALRLTMSLKDEQGAVFTEKMELNLTGAIQR